MEGSFELRKFKQHIHLRERLLLKRGMEIDIVIYFAKLNSLLLSNLANFLSPVTLMNKMMSIESIIIVLKIYIYKCKL